MSFDTMCFHDVTSIEVSDNLVTENGLIYRYIYIYRSDGTHTWVTAFNEGKSLPVNVDKKEAPKYE